MSGAARLMDHSGGAVPSPEVRLHHALADELVKMTCVLSDLAYDLGANPATLRAHMNSLQAIDRLTQTQLAIADVLRSDEPIDRRIGAITLEDLSQDLARRLNSIDPC